MLAVDGLLNRDDDEDSYLARPRRKSIMIDPSTGKRSVNNPFRSEFTEVSEVNDELPTLKRYYYKK